jgi:signal transduction histidine kinase
VTNDAAPSRTSSVAVPWSIRERMHDIGGTASVDAEEEATTLRVTVPMPEDAA